MADKKKAGVSVVPEFVAGEQPTADKFNAISVQLERASSELEKSVGDVWGESWPYSTSSTTKLTLPYGRNLTSDGKVNNAHDSFLDIANIARLIGPAANLNPTFPEFFDGEADPIYSVEDEVLQNTSATEERREFWLRFPPDLSSSIPVPGGTAGASLTRRLLTHDLVRASGDWCVTEDRKFTTFDPIPIGQNLTVTYETIPQSWGTGPDVPGSTYNVIPDPNQTANDTGIGTQCIATPAGDGYTVQLPTASHTRINDNGTNTQLNGDGDIAEAAQLSLPRVLRDNFTTGDVIPEGFVYLRDNVTGKLYSDAVYRYNDSNTLRVENVELDVAHGFSVITIGSTITEAIHDLRYKWFRHSHDGTYGEAPIHVSSLAGILESEGDTGIYVTSEIANNWMPQYLHRDGYRADSTANDNNAMRGDLVLGLVYGSPGQHLDSTYTGSNSTTVAIKFGDGTSNTEIYRTSATVNSGALRIFNDGDIWIKTDNGTATRGDINIESYNEGVNINAYGTSSVRLGGSTRIQNTGSNPFVPSSLATFENVGFQIEENAGHIEAVYSQALVHGIAAGPINTSTTDYCPAFTFNENGQSDGGAFPARSYATMSYSTPHIEGWRTPVLQALYYGQQNVVFQGKGSDGNNAGSNALVEYWTQDIPLPPYLDSADYRGGASTYALKADAVLGFTVMVKGTDSSDPLINEQWWTVGGGARWREAVTSAPGGDVYEGEQIIAYMTNTTDPSTPHGHIRILISARGEAFGGGLLSSFSKDRHSGTTCPVDVKIVLWVGAPGNTITTLPIY